MKIIALDVERTLISSAVSQFPRDGLFNFLENCRTICERIVIFTTIKEPRFRSIATLLVAEGSAPDWFEVIEYVDWSGSKKDLSFVIDANIDEILLIDDCIDYVQSGQATSWIEIAPFVAPYLPDGELQRVYNLILEKFSSKTQQKLPCQLSADINEEDKIIEDIYRAIVRTNAHSSLSEPHLQATALPSIENAAVTLFEGNREAANTWLNLPLDILGGESPLKHSQTRQGMKESLQLIGRLINGVFS